MTGEEYQVDPSDAGYIVTCEKAEVRIGHLYMGNGYGSMGQDSGTEPQNGW